MWCFIVKEFTQKKTYVYLVSDLYKIRFLGACDEFPMGCSQHEE
jgi:hypothetical protein